MPWLILSILFWGIVHSILASLKAKELAERWFGDGFTRFYRLIYNVFAALSLIPILILAVLAPDRKLYAVPFPWNAVMVFGMVVGVAGVLLGLRQTGALEFIGLSQLGGNPGTSQLTTTGLYKYVRHPLYVSGLIFIWLIPVMTVNLLAFNLALTLYILIGAYFEERKLRHIFGEEYRNYVAVTPMFIPFLKGNKKSR